MGRTLRALLVAGLFSFAHAQDLAGLWLGTLHAGPLDLRIVLEVAKSRDGFSANFQSLDQSPEKIPVSAITLDGRALKFAVESIAGSYAGALSADGSGITGDWKQSGLSFPLEFKRIDKMPGVQPRPQEPRKPYPYDEKEVSYENKKGGVKFAGTLTLPRTGAPHAAVLLITGSGPQDRDEALAGHKPFLVLADYLTRRGIAVLRVDDRGVGGSTGGPGTTEDFAGDALAGVEFLKARPEIDSRRIGLVGHSEGGVIAPMAAAQSADVAFIVMMAGTGVTGEKVILGQSYAMVKAAGANSEGAAMNRDIAMLMVHVVADAPGVEAAQQMFEEALGPFMSGWSEAQRGMIKARMPQLRAQVKTMSDPWFRVFLKLDPRPILMKVKVPVLALNGELDMQVLAKDNLPAIVEALEAGGNKDYTIVKLPRLNHLFQTAKTGGLAEYSQIDETISPVALEVMGDWIVRHTAR